MQICFCYSRERTAGLYGNSYTSNLRTCQDVFKSDYLFTFPHGMMSPISLHHCQYLLSVFFLIIIIANLVGVKCYLIVFFIWISLMTYGVEYFFLFISQLWVIFGEMSMEFVAHGSVRLSPCWIIKLFIYSGYEYHIRFMTCKYFLPLSVFFICLSVCFLLSW